MNVQQVSLREAVVLESLPLCVPVCGVQASFSSPHSVHPISLTYFMSQVNKNSSLEPQNDCVGENSKPGLLRGVIHEVVSSLR